MARARLAALDLTQASLASQSGVDPRTVQRWFAGGRAAVEDAERAAAVLGVGTAEAWDGVPEATESPFARLRSVLAVVRLREGTLGGAFAAMLENFGFLDSLIRFSAHPPRGFVQRMRIEPADRHAFAVFRVSPAARLPLAIECSGQVARRFRYVFGELALDPERALLTESFHTRSALAKPHADGSVDVHVWVGADMQELVLCAASDFRVRRLARAGSSTFDLDDPGNTHAVCFRPSAMHLREAGLGRVFDRVRGSRDGRIDVPIE